MRLSKIAVDIAPLRDSRDFRLLYAGRFVSLFGSALTTIAVSWQVYEITHAALMVGVNSLLTSLATVSGLLKGGVLADRHDRRRVLLATRIPQAAVSALLAANSAAGDRSVWPMMALCAGIGLLGGLGGPASTSAIPVLVGPRQMPAAAALIGLSTQIGAIAGPPAAGAVIAGPGVTACFVLDTISFAVFAFLLRGIRPLPPSGPPQRPGDLAALRAGLRFIRQQRMLCAVLVIDANAMVFGMPESLLPALAARHFGGGAMTFGLLCAAPAVGAVVAAGTSGWTSRVRRPGRVIIAACILWGGAVVGFGLSGVLAVAMVFLALAGMADVISEVLRSALLQNYTPDEVRGRVTSVWLAQTIAAPGLGNAEAGAVAGLIGLTGSVVSGGLACVAGACLIALLIPEFRRAALIPRVLEKSPEPAGTR
jgi:ENTS family enterobactin (siderophore) exporter